MLIEAIETHESQWRREVPENSLLIGHRATIAKIQTQIVIWTSDAQRSEQSKIQQQL